MKKLFFLVSVLLCTAVLTVSARADIIDTRPVEKSGLSPVVILLAAAVVIVAAAILIRVLRNKKHK